MVRFRSWVLSATVAPALVALACQSEARYGVEATSRAEGGLLPAPVITQPACGAVTPWPKDLFTLAWERVVAASSYTVEVDCLGCGDARDAWFSQSGAPWQVTPGLGVQGSSYRTDVVSRLRREGGRTMRWRLWAVDRLGADGNKSEWCVVPFSASGLPTPSAGGTGPDHRP
jgi:hypothetical protein